MQRIQFDIHYCYERIPVQVQDDHEGGHGLIDPYWYYIDDDGIINERYEYFYSKKSYVDGIQFSEERLSPLPHDCRDAETDIPTVLHFELPLYDFINTIDGNPNNSNTVTIDEAKNGFYLDFHGSTNGIFVNTESYNAQILPEFFMLKPGTEFKHSVDGVIYKYILRNLDIEIDFDIALGTDFIAQHHDKNTSMKFINPQDWTKVDDQTQIGIINSIEDPDEPMLALLAKPEEDN